VAAADQKQDRAERLQAIAADYEKKAHEYVNAFESAQTDAERAKAEKRRPSDAEFGKQILALAKAAPADRVAFDAVRWIFENLESPDSATICDEAVALFEKHHIKSPRLKVAIPALAECNSPKAELLLERLGDKGDSPEIRGLALFRLALGRYKRFEGNDERQLARIEALLERTRKDYGDIQPDDEDEPIAKLAEGTLFEIKYLRPGKVVPDLSGTDIAGKPLALSKFRDKVVMLVFWGSWCGPCMAKVPFERRLMEKYTGRPFSVVGVNCGDEKKKAAIVMQKQKMTWPSFFDGEDGPIVTAWHISTFPAVFLIDAKGVIRLKDPQDDYELESEIEKAVKEAGATR
jgi:thiol-disulfide isomerase/thioredoxin